MKALLLAALLIAADTPGRVEATRGAVKATLEIDPASPRLSDEPKLTLTLDADEKVDIKPPPFGDSIGGFLIRGFEQPLPEVKDGRKIQRQIYTLEPTETGRHEIASIRIPFTDHRPDAETQEGAIELEPLAIEVTSILDQDAPTLDAVKPPVAPLALEVQRVVPWIWIGGAAGAAVLLALALLWWRRAKPAPPPRTYTPGELAEQELRALLAAGLLEKGELPSFFVELTLVVRRFIERTTGVRAPEQTTDEFLREMKSHAAFDADRRARLKQFLESADLVKFAALRPGRADIEESFRRAQEFVGLPGTLRLPDAEAA